MPLSKIELDLVAQGHRITKARRAIIHIFESNCSPLSVDQITSQLTQKNILVNQSTVYRELQFLILQSKIKFVQFEESHKRYELASTRHHHHFICKSCKDVKDFVLENCLVNTLKNISIKNNFVVHDHVLDLYGVCEKCNEDIILQ